MTLLCSLVDLPVELIKEIGAQIISLQLISLIRNEHLLTNTRSLLILPNAHPPWWAMPFSVS